MRSRFDPDRVKRLAIIAMFSDDDLLERLVLKGGNLLDLVYRISTRASVDLDLSIDGDFNCVAELRRKVETCLTTVFGENGLVAFDINVVQVPPKISEDMKSFWGGYKIDFKLIEELKSSRINDENQRRREALILGKKNSKKFCIDLSKHEYCGDKIATQLDGLTIFVYSPAMFISEKIRAICQQMPEYASVVKRHASARARDFVDIQVATECFSIRFDDVKFRQVLQDTFAAKNVPLHLIGRIRGQREYHRPDFVAVKDTVKPGVVLRDFDFYFDYVVEKCRELESLWNE